ncbi:hypothetical protein QTP86_017734, partial [Hemibagrus guttatus]
AMVLCHFLDTHQEKYNLVDKNVIEIGAGTGLVTIVCSLLGAKVTSTDLPDVLGNLRYNVSRNTRGRCRYEPHVTELTWGQQLEERFPHSSCRYDYLIAADVVYSHPYLNELMETFEHLCSEDTVIFWAMRFRLDPENSFVDRFRCEDIVMEEIIAKCTDKEEIEEETEADVNKEDLSGVVRQKAWEPNFYCNLNKEIHYYAGHEIRIYESLDSYGAIIWPAGVALCQYLDSNRKTINLQDKAVLELGSGTGLVSIVASLLDNDNCKCSTGACVTASDLPEVLGNLRSNLCRNTRGYCRYTPQVAVVSWGYDLEQTFPRSVYRYDYVLAADVVYHHDFLAELLVTMRHFCQLGTTMIWANKIRFESDLAFTENFKKTFNTTLLADMCEIKIYSATMKDEVEVENDIPVMLVEDAAKQEKETEECNFGEINKKQDQCVDEDVVEELNRESEKINVNGTEEETEDNCDDKFKEAESHDSERNEQLVFQRCCSPSREDKTVKEVYNFLDHKICIENSNSDITCPAAVALCKFLETPAGQEKIVLLDQTVLELHAGTGLLSIVATLLGREVEDEQELSGGTDSEREESQVHSESESFSTDESDEQLSYQRIWESKFSYFPGKEIHYFMGHKIIIEESFDSYGAMIWPAAVALCKFLETEEGRQKINLFDKTVLEIGAGTGLLSIVITLLGAKLTATDLPEILSNLRYNLNRNTRWLRRHEPQVKQLSWGFELEKTSPRSLHYYDYVLAADVVYHHNVLDELLATMHHFCRPGTTLIWANKIRYPSDLTFLENFENIFHTTLLAELEEIRIYSATYKSS